MLGERSGAATTRLELLLLLLLLLLPLPLPLPLLIMSILLMKLPAASTLPELLETEAASMIT
jgi:hypothetical protein